MSIDYEQELYVLEEQFRAGRMLEAAYKEKRKQLLDAQKAERNERKERSMERQRRLDARRAERREKRERAEREKEIEKESREIQKRNAEADKKAAEIQAEAEARRQAAAKRPSITLFERTADGGRKPLKSFDEVTQPPEVAGSQKLVVMDVKAGQGPQASIDDDGIAYLAKVRREALDNGVQTFVQAEAEAIGVGPGASTAEVQQRLTTLQPDMIIINGNPDKMPDEEQTVAFVEHTLMVAREGERSGTTLAVVNMDPKLSHEHHGVPVADMLAVQDKGIVLFNEDQDPLPGPDGDDAKSYYSPHLAEMRLRVRDKRERGGHEFGPIPEKLVQYLPESAKPAPQQEHENEKAMA